MSIIGAGCTSPASSGTTSAEIINLDLESESPAVEIEIDETATSEEDSAEKTTMDDDKNIVRIKTEKGDIVIELYENMPITAGNFKKLASEGFYDGVTFHRVIDDFMIQGGDPTGTGMGGPGYTIEDEHVEGSTNVRGTIAMANSGPQSGGSQFFINTVDNIYLDWDKPPAASKHPVFGKVIEGMDVVDKIEQGDVMLEVTVE